MILKVSETITKVVENVETILCLDNYSNSECFEKACQLKRFVIGLIKICQLHPFLTIFAHSSSCVSSNCVKLCHIFRSIRHHIKQGVSAHISTTKQDHEHICAVIHVYGQILRMHVDTCVEIVCGIHSCKDMKRMRQESGHRVLPINFKRIELLCKKYHPDAIQQEMQPIDTVINGITDLKLSDPSNHK